jgi:hypothetical protein
MKKLLTALSLTTAMLFSAAQAELVTNSFTATFTWGSANNVASFPYNGTAIDDLTIGNAEKVGITTSSSANNFRATNWALDTSSGPDFSLTGVVDLGKYIQFTLTADAGATLNMTSIDFGVGRSATGPRQWQWRSSVDDFASILSNYSSLNASLSESGGVVTNPDANSNWAGNVLDLSDASFQGLSSVTLRLYGYNSETNTGTGGLAGVTTFDGAMVVPEPSTYALLALSGLALAGYAARRRQRQK